jgi:hypothetical protein
MNLNFFGWVVIEKKILKIFLPLKIVDIVSPIVAPPDFWEPRFLYYMYVRMLSCKSKLFWSCGS